MIVIPQSLAGTWIDERIGKTITIQLSEHRNRLQIKDHENNTVDKGAFYKTINKGIEVIIWMEKEYHFSFTSENTFHLISTSRKESDYEFIRI